jgi:hypothetical protein
MAMSNLLLVSANIFCSLAARRRSGSTGGDCEDITQSDARSLSACEKCNRMRRAKSTKAVFVITEMRMFGAKPETSDREIGSNSTAANSPTAKANPGSVKPSSSTAKTAH